jgi:hypothetical protein
MAHKQIHSQTPELQVHHRVERGHYGYACGGSSPTQWP